MPPRKTSTPTPTNHEIFDPWNTASTGHQRAENPYSNSSGWRRTRSEKLARQFHSDKVPTPLDSVDTDSANADTRNRSLPEGEWKWVSGSEAGRLEAGCRDIRSYMGVRKRGWSSTVEDNCQGSKEAGYGKRARVRTVTETGSEVEKTPSAGLEEDTGNKPGLFAGTTIYINGSTMSLVSDHRLKQLLVSHGAKLALCLARNSVTHVIVGKPAAGPGKGAGGALAAGKLHKEIARSGRQVKVVYAEWYGSLFCVVISSLLTD